MIDWSFLDLPSLQSPIGISPVTGKFYEAIVQYATVVSKVIKENKTDIRDGYQMKKYFLNYRTNGDVATFIFPAF